MDLASGAPRSDQRALEVVRSLGSALNLKEHEVGLASGERASTCASSNMEVSHSPIHQSVFECYC